MAVLELIEAYKRVAVVTLNTAGCEWRARPWDQTVRVRAADLLRLCRLAELAQRTIQAESAETLDD